MSEPEIDKQRLNQYLLGALSKSETDRLDELSITDDAFVVRLIEAENDLIDSYVGDELQGETLERFKTHYLSSQTRRNKVKFAMTLQEAAQSKSPSTVMLSKQPVQKGWFAKLFTVPVRQWGFSIAALVLLIATVFFAGQNIRLRQQISQRQANDDAARQVELELKKQIESQRAANAKTEAELAQLRADHDRLDQELQKDKEPSGATVASLILTPQLRGAGQVATLSVTTSMRTVVVHLKLEPNDFTNYRVVLLDQVTQQNIWSSGNIKAKGAANEKALSVSFPAGPLKSQGYILQVVAISDNGGSETVGEYYFRIVK
jgi:cell division protein FtsB